MLHMDESIWGETVLLNKPVFDISSTAAWRGPILPSCKSCALTLLTKQLLQQPQLLGQEAAPLCGAPLRTAGACVRGPLGAGHSAASTTDHLFPAKWCQQSMRPSRVTLQKNLCKMWCLCCRMVVCRSRLLVARCAKALQLLMGEVAPGWGDLSVTLLTL